MSAMMGRGLPEEKKIRQLEHITNRGFNALTMWLETKNAPPATVSLYTTTIPGSISIVLGKDVQKLEGLQRPQELDRYILQYVIGEQIALALSGRLETDERSLAVTAAEIDVANTETPYRKLSDMMKFILDYEGIQQAMDFMREVRDIYRMRSDHTLITPKEVVMNEAMVRQLHEAFPAKNVRELRTTYMAQIEELRGESG